MAYRKCPRCSLNYITEDETYCRICLVEMGKIDETREFDYDEDYEICPECGENLMKAGDTMCEHCTLLLQQSSIDAAVSDEAETQDAFDDTGEEVADDLFVSLESVEYAENEAEEKEEETEY